MTIKKDLANIKKGFILVLNFLCLKNTTEAMKVCSYSFLAVNENYKGIKAFH